MKITVFALTGAGLAACLAAATASAASPVRGFINGPVASVSGDTFVLTTTQVPGGKAKVAVSGKTAITQQVELEASSLKTGECVSAVGSKSAKGAIAAARITVSKPVGGACGAGFGGGAGGPRGARPPRAPRPGAGAGARVPRPGSGRPFASGNFAFALGAITAVKGSTLTLHGRQGTSTVTVSASTQIGTVERVAASAIKAKLCAFVRGTSTDKGITVTAQSVSLSEPGRNGCGRVFAPRGAGGVRGNG